MKRNLLRFSVPLGTVLVVGVLMTFGSEPLLSAHQWVARQAQAAAVFFEQSITVADIHEQYRAPASSFKKVRVLIVPGHQAEKGGTQFRGVYERDVVVDIADALKTLLSQNPRYDVLVARTKSSWYPLLETFFDTHALEIETFRKEQAALMRKYVADGAIVTDADQVYHNTASSEGIRQLYGINKWSSDAAYDVVLHLHLNDYAGRRSWEVGKYDGFAVYVPNHQYSNADVSVKIGEAIAARLSTYHATSTLPKEDQGVVEDQELIAIGSNNSVDGAALLIEYGYIYEPQFQHASVRDLAVVEYAYSTYLGLQDFFKDPVPSRYGAISFPYDWTQVAGKKGEKGPQVYALQSALRFLGHYPPSGKSFSECPVSGVFGGCTTASLTQFQSAHGLAAGGLFGPETQKALSNDLSATLLY